MARLVPAPVRGYTGGIAKEAADYLIRVKNCRPVYNMVINGPEHAGKFYVNNRVMSEEDMIEYAIERGFDPNTALG